MSLQDWEHSKENILPLKSGRNPIKLSELFKDAPTPSKQDAIAQERKRFEALIASDEQSDDPLDVWNQYVQWTSQNFTGSNLSQEMLPLLERCAREFRANPLYKNDLRYLKVWIMYAEMVSEPLDIFSYLEEQSIGTSLSLLYEAKALILENRDRFNEADKVYALGVQRNAHPIDRLRQKQKQFQARLMVRLAQGPINHQQQQQQHTSGEDSRAPLGSLATKKPAGSVRPTHPAGKPLASNGGLAYLNKRKLPLDVGSKGNFLIHEDDSNDDAENSNTTSSSNSRLLPVRELPLEKEKHKENSAFPSKWSEVRLPQKKTRSNPPAAPSFAIYEEEDTETPDRPISSFVSGGAQLRAHLDGPAREWEQLRSNPFKFHTTPQTQPQEQLPIPRRELSTAITSTDPRVSENGERLGYDRALIFVGGDELSFEEVRARKRFGHVMPVTVVEQEDEEDVAMEMTVALPGNIVQQQQKHHQHHHHFPLPMSTPVTPITPITPMNFKPTTIIPTSATTISSLPSYMLTSPTVNTKDALSVVEAMFSTPLSSNAVSDDDEETDERYSHLVDQENKPPGDLPTPSSSASSSGTKKAGVLQPLPVIRKKLTNADIINASRNKDSLPEWTAQNDVTSEFVDTVDRIDKLALDRSNAFSIFEDDTSETSSVAAAASTSTAFDLYEDPEIAAAVTDTFSSSSSLSLSTASSSHLTTPITPLSSEDNSIFDGDDSADQSQFEPEPIDPYKREIQEQQLDSVFGSFNKLPHFFLVEGDAPRCPAFSCKTRDWTGKDEADSIFSLPGDVQLQIKGRLGEGAFATVYSAEMIDKNSGDIDTAYALKVQNHASGWEFYIANEIQNRVPDECRSSFAQYYSFHQYTDRAFMLMDLGDQGTLQDAINAFLKADKKFEEPLIMYYAIEMLKAVNALHGAGIVHGDIKSDNVLIRYDQPDDDNVKWDEWTPVADEIWKLRGVRIIDFGKSIDSRLFPRGTTFLNGNQVSGFKCVEMIEGKPWTYQADLFGVCGVIHALLHGQYMEVEKSAVDGKWKPKLPFKRYWQQDIWKHLFDTLLNIPDCDSMPDLPRLIRSLEDYLVQNPAKSRAVKVNMCKLNIAMIEYLKE